MSVRVRRIGSIAGLLVLTATATILWTQHQSSTSLAEVAGLAEAGRLDDAETKLALLLKQDPRDPGANLLAAQLAMGRSERVTQSGIGSDPAPADTALEYLRRVETPDHKLAALAKLWEGKADRYLGRLEEAEASWLESLRLDPAVPEAGWLLLQEYYLQGRSEEVGSLALSLHQSEPDPRDRVLILMEPLRQEVMPPAPASLVLWFNPIASRNPTGFRANIALGLALIRSSDLDRGMSLLRKVVELHPMRRESWEALLTGLDEAGEVEELEEVMNSLPSEFSVASWTLRYRARIDEDRGNWKAASLSYRLAIKATPADPRLGYRLARALRRIGEKADADRLDGQYQDRPSENKEARDLFEMATAQNRLTVSLHPELCEKMACLREKSGYPEQAKAWRRLIETARSIQ